MIIATETDFNNIVEVLSGSLRNNPSTLFAVGQGFGSRRRLRRLIAFSTRIALDHHAAYLSDDRNGAALFFRGNVPSAPLMRQIGLVIGAIGFIRLHRVLKKEALVHSRHPDGEHGNLWYIGVRTDCQGRGSGSALMGDLLDDADESGIPVYLETSLHRNVAFYRRFGFEVYETVDYEYPFRMMKRKAAQVS